MPPADNLGFVTDYGAHFFPSKAAVVDDEATVSYEQLDRRADQVANALRSTGVGLGDRVALLFANEHRFVEAFLGVMRAGAVAVPVNVRLGYDGIRFVVEDSGARLLLVGRSLAELGERLAADCPAVALRLTVGASGESDYDRWREAADPTRPQSTVTGDDVCMQPYTSGSTGRPKGVLLHHRGQLANSDVMARVLLVRPDDRALVAVPLFHANAMCGALLPCLTAGGSISILPSFDPARMAAAIEEHRCTFLTGVPAMYQLLLSSGALDGRDTSSVRFMLCGSAPASTHLLGRLAEAFPGADVVDSYGLTEGGPVVTVTPRWGIRKQGSIGLPLPGVHVRVVDEAGTDVGVDEPGELWVKSPGAALGYHNRPDVTAARFTEDGWLRTGDLVRRDGDDVLWFLGRGDDMINCAGENVYPREVETLLREHPAVSDAVVVPVPHEIKGQVPVAFVVPLRGVVDEETLKAFCLERGAAYAHPRRVFVIDELPLAGTGKVDRLRLTREAETLARA